MGQIDQLLRRVAGAPVRTVLLWRSRGISWKVITSNLLPVPSLYQTSSVVTFQSWKWPHTIVSNLFGGCVYSL